MLNRPRSIHFFVMLFLGIFFIQGCIQPTTKVSIKTKAAKNTSFSISSVRIQNNQLVLIGNNLQDVAKVKLKRSGFDEDFTPESVSATQVIANGTRLITVGVGQVFDLIISNASGAATFQVDFTLSNHSVALNKLATTGATAGQVIKFNGTDWAPASLTEAQIYLGTWNASNNIGGVPDLSSVSSTPGEYYIASHAGTLNGVSYAIGDWIISDGYQWQKIAASKTSVTSFQGRQGIVTLTPADYVSLINTGTNKITGSSINDLFDVNISSPSNGSVLKYNGSKWVVGTDNTGIAAGSIVNADISASAAIDQSKIANLTTDLAALQSTSGLPAAVRAVTLTGLSSATGTVSASDTILGAFGKMMGTQSDYVSRSSAGTTVMNGALSFTGVASSISVPTSLILGQTAVTNVEYVTNAIASNGVWDKGASSSINYTAGNVGIGVTSPTNLLDIGGSGVANGGNLRLKNLVAGALGPRFILDNAAGFGQGSIDFYTVSGADPLVVSPSIRWLGKDNGAYSADMLFQSSYNGGAMTTNMTILGTGNVGIGTTSPASTLDVRGEVKVGSGASSWTIGTSDPASGAWLRNDGNNAVISNNSGHIYLGFGGDLTKHIYIGNLQAVDIVGSAPSQSLYVASSGNVGFGNTSPLAPVHAGGEVSDYSAYSFTNTGAVISSVGADQTSSRTNTLTLMRDGSNGIIYAGAAAFDLSRWMTNGVEPHTQLDIRLAKTHTSDLADVMSLRSNGNVGIANTSPVARLDVVGSATNGEKIAQFKGGANGATVFFTTNDATYCPGCYMGSPVLDSSDSYMFVKPSLLLLNPIYNGQANWTVNGSGSIFSVGGGTALAGTSIVLGSDNTYQGPFRIKDGSGNNLLYIDPATARVGIGTSSPTEELEVVGDIKASGTITGSSDRRLKRDIRPIREALDKLDSIVGVKYFWIEPKAHTEGEQIGVIAQDVERVFPQAVKTGADGFKSVSYMGLMGPVIEAVKELHGKFKTLLMRVSGLEAKEVMRAEGMALIKAENLNLKQENAEIKERLLRLEALMMKERKQKP